MSKARVAYGATVAGLLIISLLAAAQVDPQGPLDARDYTRVAGMSLEQPGWTALIEPLTAPLRIISGAPDFRIAFISCLVWIILGAALWRAIADARTCPEKPTRLRVARAIKTGCGAGILLALCVGAALLAHVPGWRLTTANPNALILDPHSHTLASHDGLVAEEDTINWHRAAGFNAVAITEHEIRGSTIFGDTDNQDSLSISPAVIRGFEGHYGKHRTYLIGLGLHSVCSLATAAAQKDPLASVIAEVRNVQGGAVIAMSYRLPVEEVSHLANAGIDGFEIANFGHPNVSAAVRAEILKVAKQRGIALVASSDLHGWSSTLRTWTVIDNLNPAHLSGGQASALAVETLRSRGSQHIIPVVAGYLGTPSILRMLFAPFTEAVRYAEELSFDRVASWWIWSAIVSILAYALRRRGHDPLDVFVRIVVSIAGGTFLWSGWHLVLMQGGLATSSAFSLHVGVALVLIGIAAVASLRWREMFFVVEVTPTPKPSPILSS